MFPCTLRRIKNLHSTVTVKTLQLKAAQPISTRHRNGKRPQRLALTTITGRTTTRSFSSSSTGEHIRRRRRLPAPHIVILEAVVCRLSNCTGRSKRKRSKGPLAPKRRHAERWKNPVVASGAHLRVRKETFAETVGCRATSTRNKNAEVTPLENAGRRTAVTTQQLESLLSVERGTLPKASM